MEIAGFAALIRRASAAGRVLSSATGRRRGRRTWLRPGAAGLALLLAAWLAGCGGSQTNIPPAATPGTTFSITTTSDSLTLPTAMANVPYAFGFQTNIGQSGINGIPPVYYELASGATLPPGLTLSASGFISGTPTQVGNFNVGIAAIDSSSTPLIATSDFSLEVLQPGAELTEVASNNLGGHGQNGDITVATTSATNVPYAYIGTLGVAGSCPATGVKIVSLSTATNPQLVGEVAALAGTNQIRPRVTTGISSPYFHSGSEGDMLAVGLEPCNSEDATPNEEGVEFYDVTDPTHPISLGFWESGVNGVGDAVIVGVPGPTNAAGQVDQSENQIYALVAVPGSETQIGVNNPEGDLRVLNITNPSQPIEVGNWGILTALDETVGSLGIGQDQRVFLSTIELSPNNQTAYLSYWDGGIVILNVSNPAVIASGNPTIFVGQTLYPITQAATTTLPSEPEGNTYEAMPMADNEAMLVTDDVCASTYVTSTTNANLTVPTNPYVPTICGAKDDVTLDSTAGWGYLRTYSLTTPAAPTTPTTPTIGSYFITPQSMSDPPPDDGIYTAHDMAWNGNDIDPHAYVAWYSAGFVDLDLTSITPPQELSAWAPPATPDPNGNNPAVNNPDLPLVVSVAALTQNGTPYVLASDINSGLWVVQETPAPALTILTTSLPVANVNIPYSAQMAAINGSLGASNLIWEVAPVTEDALPPGLSISTSGAITGTPTTSDTYVVTFEVSDGAGNSATETITMTVNETFQIVPPTVPLGTLNETYSLTLTTENGVTPIYWTVVGGALPNGLQLGQTTGIISGSPTGLGTSNFVVQATDSSAVPNVNTLAFSITTAAFEFQTTTLSTMDQGVAYTQPVTLANGTAPITPVITSGTLPPGISATSGGSNSDTINITGTPTTPGTYTFTLTAIDDDNEKASQSFTVVVEPFAISTTTLPAAEVGYGYQFSLLAEEGTAPYTFTIISGSLPQGLSLATTGDLTGVPAPSTAGTYNFTVQATDANGLVTTQALTLVVNPN